ncbi:hypothetical protein BJV78DRAFT_1169762 [Lactifluus subvellereus]|nr:hypothetical protein BJV78DRAFT_1169762 [Lactifluus subvellereus]
MKEDTMAWFKSRIEGIILVRPSTFLPGQTRLLLYPLYFPRNKCLNIVCCCISPCAMI